MPGLLGLLESKPRRVEAGFIDVPVQVTRVINEYSSPFFRIKGVIGKAVLISDQSNRFRAVIDWKGNCMVACIMDTFFWPYDFVFDVNGVRMKKPTSDNPRSMKFWMQCLMNGETEISIDIKNPYDQSYFYVVLLDYELCSISVPQRFPQSHWKSLFEGTETSDNEIKEYITTQSLICPLSMERIKVPVRGVNCLHLSCFDFWKFIQYQREFGEWKCPICMKACALSDLMVDPVIESVLSDVPPQVDSIDIDKNGEYLYEE